MIKKGCYRSLLILLKIRKGLLTQIFVFLQHVLTAVHHHLPMKNRQEPLCVLFTKRFFEIIFKVTQDFTPEPKITFFLKIINIRRVTNSEDFVVESIREIKLIILKYDFRHRNLFINKTVVPLKHGFSVNPRIWMLSIMNHKCRIFKVKSLQRKSRMFAPFSTDKRKDN